VVQTIPSEHHNRRSHRSEKDLHGEKHNRLILDATTLTERIDELRSERIRISVGIVIVILVLVVGTRIDGLEVEEEDVAREETEEGVKGRVEEFGGGRGDGEGDRREKGVCVGGGECGDGGGVGGGATGGRREVG